MSANHSVKRFIQLWMGFLAVCFILITATLVLSTNRLQSMSEKIYFDAMALEYARRLESDLLEQRREELLWRSTEDAGHLQRDEQSLKELHETVRQMHFHMTSPEEEAVLNDIEHLFGRFFENSQISSPTAIEQLSVLTDSLLMRVEDYKSQNLKQMKSTIDASSKLNAQVDHWSMVLIVLTSLLVIICALMLIRRIIQPVFSLIRTSQQYGDGNFEARVPVVRDDEIGQLSRQFNEMAGNILRQMRDRQSFVATVAHDIKNPLIFIGATARRIKRDDALSKDQAALLDCMIEEADHLETMLGDLMDTVQIENGNFTLLKTDLELESFIRNVIERQSMMVEGHQIRFDSTGECTLPVDRKRMERVLVNLLSNAVKYSPKDSLIRVEFDRLDDRAVIRLIDQGYGIDPDDLSEIFQPFKRSNRTRSMAAGTGLGLFSVKKIIESHGGRIDITSVVDSGTTVEIILPIQDGN